MNYHIKKVETSTGTDVILYRQGEYSQPILILSEYEWNKLTGNIEGEIRGVLEKYDPSVTFKNVVFQVDSLLSGWNKALEDWDKFGELLKKKYNISDDEYMKILKEATTK